MKRAREGWHGQHRIMTRTGATRKPPLAQCSSGLCRWLDGASCCSAAQLRSIGSARGERQARTRGRTMLTLPGPEGVFMDTPTYLIVRDNDLARLERLVNERIGEGYSLAGQLFAVTPAQGGALYVQPLLLEYADEEEEEVAET
jgi:hypothetical protein